MKNECFSPGRIRSFFTSLFCRKKIKDEKPPQSLQAFRGIPLARLTPGQRGTVAGITSVPDTLKKLAIMGILPGARLTVKQKNPVFVIEIGYTCLAMDEHIAGAIWVEKDG